jgi:hypothetical protein
LIFCVADSLGKVSQASCTRLILQIFSSFCSGVIWQISLTFVQDLFLQSFSSFYVQDSFGKVSLKLLFRTHFAKFFELLVQDSFGKVSQVFCVQNAFGKVSEDFCSGLIWQSSSSFMFTTDLAKFFKLIVQD